MRKLDSPYPSRISDHIPEQMSMGYGAYTGMVAFGKTRDQCAPTRYEIRDPLMFSPDVPESEIDALFAEVAVDGPGAAVGIYQSGESVLAKGYGLADLESRRPVTAQTPFHVASVSKQFTACAIAMLAQQGKVCLDEDVREYLPFVPDFGHTITIRHLLHHTSGLRNQIMLLLLSGQGTENRVTQQQIINLVTRQEALNFPPGTDYAYTNTGYILLAEVVFRATGKTLREFTTEQIFDPLGMEGTFFLDDVTEVVPYRANSYTRRRTERPEDENGWARSILNYENVGSSNLVTTVKDLGAWARNFTLHAVGGAKLNEQMCSTGELDDGTAINYGFGLERGELNGRTVYSHTGSDAAFRSVFAHFPTYGFTVAILANTELGLMSKVRAIADLYLPRTAQAVSTPPKKDTDNHLSEYAGTYVPEHDISCRIEIHEGSLFHCIESREPQKLTVRQDGTLDFDVPGSLSFIPIRDAAGQVTGLNAPRSGYGLPQHLRRVETLENPVDDLTEYVGEYRSPELDITYSIETDQDTPDRLVVTSLWSNSPAVVSPVIPDRFECAGNRKNLTLRRVLVFQRDDEGRVDGLLMHLAGERNIHFNRVGDPRPELPIASTRPQGVWG